ncbi:MAG: hypothetical protein HY716_05375 [Planctomycetes bacterium]|nr:hypothetical protein [Planctomycetota bacterium]
MKFFINATHGSDDPTRATLSFLQAKGAVEAGHEVKISLSGDAVVLLDLTVAENVHGMGLPPLKELIAFLRERSVPVFG